MSFGVTAFVFDRKAACMASQNTTSNNASSVDGQGREGFSSRLGFLLISAGCAIGLGNIWRFPYITGEYGGAAFVIMYLVFLAIFALPALIMEFAAGRASQRSIARSYDVLEPAGTKWHAFKWLALAGNYLLMMFYTTVGGWMLAFVVKSASGEFVGLESSQVADVFNGLLADLVQLAVYMLIIVGVGVGATFDKVAGLAKHALLREVGAPAASPRAAEREAELLSAINATGIGPAALGGGATALAVHLETAPCHIAALPVAVNMGCSAMRSASIELIDWGEGK